MAAGRLCAAVVSRVTWAGSGIICDNTSGTRQSHRKKTSQDLPFAQQLKIVLVNQTSYFMLDALNLHSARPGRRKPLYLIDFNRGTKAWRKYAVGILSLVTWLSALGNVESFFTPSLPFRGQRLLGNVVHVSASDVQVRNAPTRRMHADDAERTRKHRRKDIQSAKDESHATIRNQQEEIERLYRVSSSEEDVDEIAALQMLEQNVAISKNMKNIGVSEGNETESDFLMRKRVRVTMKKARRISNETGAIVSSMNRSSTMPGLSLSDDKYSAFRAGIRIVEERTGRRYSETDDKKSKRRRVNGEALYKRSPSVPDSLIQFADEIHQEERISRTEEIELGEKTQEAIRLQNLYDVLVMKLDREPTNEEWCAASGKINMEAIKQAIKDGLEAKNKLVTSNLRMVQSVVNTYIRNGLSAQYNAGDLMQEGIMALIRAAEKFEPDRGWKFSTYATYWVRSSVKRSQIYQSRIITVPQRLNENHKRLRRIESESLAVTGIKPTRKELGEMVGMTELQVERCMTAMEQRCYSLDEAIQNTLKPGNNERKDTLIDIIEVKDADREYEVVERALLREDLVRTLNRYLSPEEVEVLLLRYGLAKRPTCLRDVASDRQVSIAELSNIFGMKPDKIRRMIDSSLKRLKGLGMDELLAYERDFL